MAVVIGKKHFGQYTLEHLFDDEYTKEFSINFITINGKSIGNEEKVKLLENFDNIFNEKVKNIEFHGNNNTVLIVKYEKEKYECIIYENGLVENYYIAANFEKLKNTKNSEIMEKDVLKIVKYYIENGRGSGNVFWNKK